MTKDHESYDKLFSLAYFAYERAGLNSIVLITDYPDIAFGRLPEAIQLHFVCASRRLSSHEKHRIKSHFPNSGFYSPKDLSDDFLRDKLVVCVLGSRFSRLLFFFKSPSLGRWLSRAALSLICSPARSKKIIRSRLKISDGTSLQGVIQSPSGSGTSEAFLSIGGRLMGPATSPGKLQSVLAIVHVYNETDVLTETIAHLLSQGVDVHIIDNWSDDGTYEIIKSLAAEHPRVTYERFPQQKVSEFRLELLLKRVESVARSKKEYDWIFLNDADEIRWSPWKDITLQEAFSFVDHCGFNAVDFTVFNFVPTKEGFSDKDSLKTFFRYGEFGTLSGYFVQVKAWKNNPRAVLAPSGGHRVSFPGLKIYPIKFLLAHYPIRSTAHGRRKVFKDRLPRFAAQEKKIGWHVQYSGLSQDSSFIGDPEKLICFDRSFYERYLIERISGIGVERSPR